MKTALYPKWQQSLSSFIEETCIDISVIVSILCRAQRCSRQGPHPAEESFPFIMVPNLIWNVLTSSTLGLAKDYMTELGYILKITKENSNSFSMITNPNTTFH